MIEIIAGEKGKGKTKALISMVNDNMKITKGNIVFLDKNNKHIYELSNQIRLINVPDYQVNNFDMFIGFILGIISQDHDLDKIYLDNFLAVSRIDKSQIEYAIKALLDISNNYNFNFVISISMDNNDLPEDIQKYVTIAL